MARVPQSTRQIFNAITQLNTLNHTLYNRVKTNSAGESLKLKKVMIDVGQLIDELQGLVEKESGKKGATIEEVKGKLQAEAQKRRAGQLKSSDMCEEVVQKGALLDGAMVALYPPLDVAKKMAQAGGEAIEQLHLTLIFFKDKAVDRDDWDKVASIVEKVASKHPKLKGHYGGTGRFVGEDEDVVYTSPDVPGLGSFREDLAKELDASDFEISHTHGFTPHTTCAYISKEEKTPEIIKEKIPVSFSQVYLVVGGKKTALNLGN